MTAGASASSTRPERGTRQWEKRRHASATTSWWGSNPEGSSSSPSSVGTDSSSHDAPGPHAWACTSESPGRQTRWSVPTPSGVWTARVAVPSRPNRDVGSPEPRRKTPSWARSAISRPLRQRRVDDSGTTPSSPTLGTVVERVTSGPANDQLTPAPTGSPALPTDRQERGTMARETSRDRRERVAEMQAAQKRAVRRRLFVVIGACVAVVAIIAAAAAWCDAVTNDPASGSSDHVGPGTNQAGVTKIQYATVPPSSGKHFVVPAVDSRRVYTVDDAPSIETLVHNLEHGYTILW